MFVRSDHPASKQSIKLGIIFQIPTILAAPTTATTRLSSRRAHERHATVDATTTTTSTTIDSRESSPPQHQASTPHNERRRDYRTPVVFVSVCVLLTVAPCAVCDIDIEDTSPPPPHHTSSSHQRGLYTSSASRPSLPSA